MHGQRGISSPIPSTSDSKPPSFRRLCCGAGSLELLGQEWLLGPDLQAAASPPHHPHSRLTVPISISNPELLRHSTELVMDSGFSPKSQRMGAMVAFQHVAFQAGVPSPGRGQALK